MKVVLSLGGRGFLIIHNPGNDVGPLLSGNAISAAIGL